jgi:hypothetical protein
MVKSWEYFLSFSSESFVLYVKMYTLKSYNIIPVTLYVKLLSLTITGKHGPNVDPRQKYQESKEMCIKMNFVTLTSKLVY